VSNRNTKSNSSSRRTTKCSLRSGEETRKLLALADARSEYAIAIAVISFEIGT
jgi:hypothetical protein